MKDWRACCTAGVGALLTFGAPSGVAQQVVRTPRGTSATVPPPTVEQARAALLGVLPGLADVGMECPRSERDARAVEADGVVLVQRMKAYPELVPAVSLTVERWKKNWNQRVAHCSGRKMEKGSADGGGLEAVVARRYLQISKASQAFARYRVALGY